jgi:5-methylcytosine-specific restriction endonuclease McrA
MAKERKQLVKKLDALCRKILLIRDQLPGQMFRCISCRRLLPLNVAQVGHYISRRYESVRWDLKNINLQCASCNKWQSGNPIEYRKALVEMHGEKEVAKMETFYRQSLGYSAFDLSQMVNEYKKLLSEFEAKF